MQWKAQVGWKDGLDLQRLPAAAGRLPQPINTKSHAQLGKQTISGGLTLVTGANLIRFANTDTRVCMYLCNVMLCCVMLCYVMLYCVVYDYDMIMYDYV